MHKDLFDLTLQTYLNQVETGTGTDESYILLGKMKMLAELYPSLLYQESIDRLPVPIELDRADYPFYNSQRDCIVYDVSIRYKTDQYRMYLHYDESVCLWKFDKLTYLYDNREEDELTMQEVHELYLIFHENHPAISSLVTKGLQRLYTSFHKFDRPFSTIYKFKSNIYFSLEGTDMSYCYKLNKNELLSSSTPLKPIEFMSKQYFHLDSNLKYIITRTDLVDRIKNHPQIRLRLLFEEE